eukprot:scaffold7415_cov170-Amphora_coffeaeformis.AAC.5
MFTPSTRTTFVPILLTLVLFGFCSLSHENALADISYWTESSWAKKTAPASTSSSSSDTANTNSIREIPPYFPMPTNWSTNREDLYDPEWLLVSPKLNLAVTWIPKVMCSSIRRALNSIECDMSNRRKCAQSKKRSKHGRAEAMYQPNMIRVVFLRDPFERVLSAYYNSDTNRYIKIPKCGSWKKPGCTIEKWVSYLYNQKKSAFRNEHFRSQAKIAQFTKMHYNYIFRMSSSIDQDFFWHDLVKSKPLVLNQRINSMSTPANTTALQDKVKQKFNNIPDHTILQMLTVYKEDFKLWEMSLAQGSRKDPAVEYTMYDYYKEFLEEDLKQKYPLKYNQSQLSCHKSFNVPMRVCLAETRKSTGSRVETTTNDTHS